MFVEKCPKEKLNTAVGHVIFFSNRHSTFIDILMKCIPIKRFPPSPSPHHLNMAHGSHMYGVPKPSPLINMLSDVCHHLAG